MPAVAVMPESVTSPESLIVTSVPTVAVRAAMSVCRSIPPVAVEFSVVVVTSPEPVTLPLVALIAVLA